LDTPSSANEDSWPSHHLEMSPAHPDLQPEFHLQPDSSHPSVFPDFGPNLPHPPNFQNPSESEFSPSEANTFPSSIEGEETFSEDSVPIVFDHQDEEEEPKILKDGNKQEMDFFQPETEEISSSPIQRESETNRREVEVNIE